MQAADSEPVYAPLAHHFETMEQQHRAALLGMWVFLITEVLLFGGIFLGYAVYREQMHADFVVGSKLIGQHALGRDDMPLLGGINTVVLLASSFTMALAVRAGQVGDKKAIVRFLGLTFALGVVFLGIKGYEYHHDWELALVPSLRFDESRFETTLQARHVELFFVFYFTLTGLHAIHMVIGMSILAVIGVRAARGRFSAAYYTPVELFGLYWHFVDVVWIFLFPLLYLIRGGH